MNINSKSEGVEPNKIFEHIEKMISTYAQTRQELKKLKEDENYRKYLAGNDNYIGIFGEYWAIRFFEQFHYDAIEDFLDKRKNGKVSQSEEWVDIELIHKENIKEQISVKTIFEDKNKTSGSIKYRSSDNDELLSIVIIKLNDNLVPEELLYIRDLDENLVDGIKEYRTRWKDKEDKSINFKYYPNGFDPSLQTIYEYCEGKFTVKNQNI